MPSLTSTMTSTLGSRTTTARHRLAIRTSWLCGVLRTSRRRASIFTELQLFLRDLSWRASRPSLPGNRDFSSVATPGFYVTLDSRQSAAWAVRAANRRRNEGRNGGPAIVEFVLPREALARLHTKTFGVNDFNEWWQFVRACRRGEAHKYDAVVRVPISQILACLGSRPGA